jgi:hypothetical protein
MYTEPISRVKLFPHKPGCRASRILFCREKADEVMATVIMRLSPIAAEPRGFCFIALILAPKHTIFLLNCHAL